MRTFIAIEISDQILAALEQIQSHLKYSGADVKWVEPKNIHLTLKFLGEASEEKCGKIKSVLDEIGHSIKPFEISLKDVGAFPKIDYPRVIWVGLDKGAKESTELARAIDEKLSKLGFECESRPFAAHLTLGRVRSSKNREALREKIESIDMAGARGQGQVARSVVLFQSTLAPHGSIYSKLHETTFLAP